MTTVRVEARHMDGALRKDVCHCPIAKALREVVRDDVRVEVSNHSVDFMQRHAMEWLTFNAVLPEQARRFTIDWDGGWNPDPPTFDLDIPPHLLRSSQ